MCENLSGANEQEQPRHERSSKLFSGSPELSPSESRTAGHGVQRGSEEGRAAARASEATTAGHGVQRGSEEGRAAARASEAKTAGHGVQRN